MKLQAEILVDEVRLGLYLFRLDPVADAIREVKPRKAVLEAPPGLVRYLPTLARLLGHRYPSTRFLVKLNPSYGGCDLGLEYARMLGAELLIHVGHGPYPLCEVELDHPTRVVYVEALHALEEDTVRQAVNLLQDKCSGRICVVYSLPEKLYAQRLGMEVNAKVLGEVLGCYYASITLGRDCDCIVVVAGGSFHAIGAGLVVASHDPSKLEEVQLLAFDPYRGTVTTYNRRVLAMLSHRMMLVHKVYTSCKRFGLIVGLKSCQYRPKLVERIVQAARQAGVSLDILAASELRPELLDNLAVGEYDAYIVTSCPRLALDDFNDYWKPVLTPGESLMVFHGELTRYLFPW